MKRNSDVQKTLWLIAIGLWLVTGVSVVALAFRMVGDTSTIFSDNAQVNVTGIENGFTFASSVLPLAIIVTICAIAWTVFCKSQAAKS